MEHLTILVKPASSLCDMACEYCFYRESAEGRISGKCGIMSRELSHRLIDLAFDTNPSSVSFVFQGGEPLLAGIDFYRDFTHEVRGRNKNAIPVIYTLQTNAVGITPEFAKLFADEHFLIGVSLDGTKDIHDRLRKSRNESGSYDDAIRGIELLSAHNVPINILTVMTRDICREPKAVWDALFKYEYLQFIPYIPRGEYDGLKPSDEELSGFLTYTFRRYADATVCGERISVRDFDGYIALLLGEPPVSCAAAGACGAYLAIEADGSVYPCDFYMTDELLLGNIKTDNVTRLLSSDKLNAFKAASPLHRECQECRFLGLCRGACPRLRNKGINIYCNAYREFFAEAAPDIIALAKIKRERKQNEKA